MNFPVNEWKCPIVFGFMRNVYWEAVVCPCVLCAASKVSFEDSEKQKIYETISFDKIRAEVDELKVSIFLSVFHKSTGAFILLCNCSNLKELLLLSGMYTLCYLLGVPDVFVDVLNLWVCSYMCRIVFWRLQGEKSGTVLWSNKKGQYVNVVSMDASV